jgi:hypothetical protein
MLTLEEYRLLSRFVDELDPYLPSGPVIGRIRFGCDGQMGATGVWQNQEDQSIVVVPGESSGEDKWYSLRERITHTF